ncbi:MAG TPA: T9SS type A sorting domain-containing protein [Saprospiraceae bacterium]|nr:T9SS type A sorting domain-containing protein [Saprospiraceae bacterium]
MKNHQQNPIRLVFTIIAILFINCIGHAILYTATSSGNWSNPLTWGGVVPETELKDNQVLIPTGITVNMDVDVFLNGTPVILEVNGTLLAKPNSIFTASWGLISGTGIMTFDNMEINGGTTMIFNGVLTTKYLTNGLPDFKVEADVNVTQSLFLTNGKMTLIDNGSLTMGINADIVVTHGAIILSGGSLELNNPYNVNYTNESTDAGAELIGLGLNNVLVNVQDSASKVVLSTNMSLTGTLNLMNGTLSLNGHDLRIEGHIGINDNGTLSSSGVSNLIINTKESPGGSLKFIQGEDILNNLAVEIKDGGKLIMDSNINIDGLLEFKAGKLDIGNNRVKLASAASISGASLSSYIITGANGNLSMNVKTAGGNKVLFPIGTSAYYAPAQFSLSPNSNNLRLNLNVRPDVWQNVNSGIDLSIVQPLVDFTWNLSSDTAISNINLTSDLMWPVNAEVNGFNRKKAYESSYQSNKWDKITSSGSIALGNGLYTITRDNITNLSSLTVFDENAITPVNNLIEYSNVIVYPNPVTSTLYIKNKIELIANGKAEIFNLSGELLKTYHLVNSNEAISVLELIPGTYLLKITVNGTSEVKRFIKQ